MVNSSNDGMDPNPYFIATSVIEGPAGKFDTSSSAKSKKSALFDRIFAYVSSHLNLNLNLQSCFQKLTSHIDQSR